MLARSYISALIPVAYLACSSIVFCFSLHCSSQAHRWLLLPFFLTFSILSFTSSRSLDVVTGLDSLWTVGVALYIVHVISLLHVEKWPAPRPAGASTKDAKPRKLTWYLDLRGTYRLWGNPQLLNLKRDQDDATDSYTLFFLLRLLRLPIYWYLYTKLFPMIFSEAIFVIYSDDVGPEQQILLRRLTSVSAREIVVRGHTAIYWIFEAVVMLDSANAILACFFVAIGFDRPSDWPSLFGTPISACGLRNFWSKFWHTLAVRPYASVGKAAASALSLQPGSFAHKSFVAFVVFGISGLSHSAAKWQMGGQDCWLEAVWFLSNFLACSTESVFLSNIRRIAKYLGCSVELKTIEESWFGWLFGYVWVFAFFFWSVPKSKYPQMYEQAKMMEEMAQMHAQRAALIEALFGANRNVSM